MIMELRRRLVLSRAESGPVSLSAPSLHTPLPGTPMDVDLD
jgi:hypothetical protein